MPDFALSVFGSELHLCHFDGFNKPLKTVLFQPLSFTVSIPHRVPLASYSEAIVPHFGPLRFFFGGCFGDKQR